MINKTIFGIKGNKVCEHPELIENYELAIADKTQTWDCHHRLETHTADGELRSTYLTRAELKEMDMYYHRPPEELIFLTCAEHRRVHQKDVKRTEECRLKMSKSHLGKKRAPFSEEWKKNMSKAHKGVPKTEECKRKLSEAAKGKVKSAETRKKMSEARKAYWMEKKNGKVNN